MKYMTDANISGLAKELRAEGIDCETVHKLMVMNEDSRIPIKDPAILKFLTEQKNQLTLITMDTELSEYCKALRDSVHKDPRPGYRIHQEE